MRRTCSGCHSKDRILSAELSHSLARYQRAGYGRQLFEAMLAREGSSPETPSRADGKFARYPFQVSKTQLPGGFPAPLFPLFVGKGSDSFQVNQPSKSDAESVFPMELHWASERKPNETQKFSWYLVRRYQGTPFHPLHPLRKPKQI